MSPPCRSAVGFRLNVHREHNECVYVNFKNIEVDTLGLCYGVGDMILILRGVRTAV